MENKKVAGEVPSGRCGPPGATFLHNRASLPAESPLVRSVRRLKVAIAGPRGPIKEKWEQQARNRPDSAAPRDSKARRKNATNLAAQSPDAVTGT